MTEEFLFSSAHAALVFAFNFSQQQYDRPRMNSLAAPNIGSNKGLAGLDGAAQSGMIRAEVRDLGKLAESILIARTALRDKSCECRSTCCSGKKPNREWTSAIDILADHVRHTALAGCSANGLMRREYVLRHFSPKDQRVSLESIAKRHDINSNTAAAHYGKVSSLFAGKRQGREVSLGLEGTAQNAIEARLRAIGLVGDAEN